MKLNFKQENESTFPLIVNLNTALLNSSLDLECGIAFIRGYPLHFLMRSKNLNSKSLFDSAPLDISLLPYDVNVIQLIKKAKADGRSVVLVTSKFKTQARKISLYLGVDYSVLPDGQEGQFCRYLVEVYGEKKFDYIDSGVDISTCKAARSVYLINPSHEAKANIQKDGNFLTVIKTEKKSVHDWLKAIRLHQWLKNILLFVPLLTAHQLNSFELLWDGVLAFLLFGCCASSVYILNDLIDISDDRHHSSKRYRPFAAGRLSIRSGLTVIPLLLAFSFGGGLLLFPVAFVESLICYYVLTLAYSLFLKRYMAIDVIALALLYTLRIVAGALAFSLPLTFWILAFSMFIFLSLALVKRYAELREARCKGKTEKTRGRGYYPDDLEMLSSLGAASGYLSVMVLALYIRDPITSNLYRQPELIWLACPLLLFWITRVWMLTHRGLMHEDPVVFAARDRISILVGVLFGLVFWVAA